MNKFQLLFIALLATGSANAQETSDALKAAAHDNVAVVAGASFTTFFDNREFSPCNNQTSMTQFSARLTPWVGLQWQEHNRLVAGVGMRRDFGRDNDVLTETALQFYYSFTDSRWQAHMGIFERGVLLGEMSDIIYDPLHSYEDNLIMGTHIAWRGRNSHIEAAIDWEGQPTSKTREKFRILSTAQQAWKLPYIGYDLSVLHLANDDLPDEVNPTGVVDHIQVLPYVGMRFGGGPFTFDLRATMACSIQRDRRAGDSHSPMGGIFGASVSRWDVTLSHQVYAGKGQQVFRERYGDLLYSGNPLYSSRHYNKTTIAYRHSFFDKTVNLDVRFIFHHDGYGMGTEQMLALGVDMERVWKTGWGKH